MNSTPLWPETGVAGGTRSKSTRACNVATRMRRNIMLPEKILMTQTTLDPMTGRLRGRIFFVVKPDREATPEAERYSEGGAACPQAADVRRTNCSAFRTRHSTLQWLRSRS